MNLISIFGIYIDIDETFVNVLDLDDQIKFSEINKYYYNLIENNIKFNEIRNSVIFPSYFNYDNTIIYYQKVNKVTETIALHCHGFTNIGDCIVKSPYKIIIYLISRYNDQINSTHYNNFINLLIFFPYRNKNIEIINYIYNYAKNNIIDVTILKLLAPVCYTGRLDIVKWCINIMNDRNLNVNDHRINYSMVYKHSNIDIIEFLWKESKGTLDLNIIENMTEDDIFEFVMWSDKLEVAKFLWKHNKKNIDLSAIDINHVGPNCAKFLETVRNEKY